MILLWVLVATTVVGTVAFITFWRDFRKPFPPAQSPNGLQSTSPGQNFVSVAAPSTSANASSETAQWKIYQNTVVGYTIMYPEGIQISELGVRDILVTRIGVPYGGQEGKVPLGGMAIYFRGISGLEKGVDLWGSVPEIPWERTTVNGYPAIRFTTGSYVVDYYIADLRNERMVRASIGTAGDIGYEESSFRAFEQIIQTIAFLDTGGE